MLELKWKGLYKSNIYIYISIYQYINIYIYISKEEEGPAGPIANQFCMGWMLFFYCPWWTLAAIHSWKGYWYWVPKSGATPECVCSIKPSLVLASVCCLGPLYHLRYFFSWGPAKCMAFLCCLQASCQCHYEPMGLPRKICIILYIFF